MVPVTIIFEPLSECMLLGMATSFSLAYLFHVDPISTFLSHVLIWFLMDWWLIHVVQNGSLPFNRFQFLVIMLTCPIQPPLRYYMCGPIEKGCQQNHWLH